MIFLKRAMGMAALAIGLSSAPVFSATLDVAGGQLLGASGVDVGGTLYDVQFVDGTCTALFGGCDAASDFTFTTSADALAASQALLDLVFIDGVDGLFDSDPELTNGITSASFAFVITPYAIGTSVVNVYSANNLDPLTGSDSVTFFTKSFGTDTTTEPNVVYADWQKSAAAVPLPAGGALLLSAFGGIAALRRRKKRAV